MQHKIIGSQQEEKNLILQDVYTAPDPFLNQPTGYRTLDFIINGVKNLPNFLFGSASSMPILPAQMRAPVTVNKKMIEDFWLKKNVHVKQFQVKTFDEARLDSVEITHRTHSHNDIHIIKFNGNGAFYEDQLPSLVDDAVRLKATVIAFNYRGVGNSLGSPSSKTKLVTDGIAEVQRLLDQKVDPHKIVLDGLSLGGGIATLVAKHFHDQGIKVNLFNDRSFSSISSTATRMILGEIPDTTEQVIETTSYSSLQVSDWEINAAAAFKTIPDQNKGYMFVAESKDNLSENIGDGVIPHKSSLHEALHGKRGQGHYCFRMFAPGILSTVTNGHNARRNMLLFAKDPKFTGQDVFDNFVRNVTL